MTSIEVCLSASERTKNGGRWHDVIDQLESGHRVLIGLGTTRTNGLSGTFYHVVV